MIPLYDRNRTRTLPVITLLLIGVNVLAFLYELRINASGGEEALQGLFHRYGVRPACIAALLKGKREIVVEEVSPTTFLGLARRRTYRIPIGAASCLLPLLTSLFLHAGWGHLLGNMWFLWLFGDNVEDRLGHVRFLLFYIVAGVLATVVHVGVTLAFGGDGLVPTIGASGAVSAILGGYFIAFPRARIVTLVPIFFFLYLVELPAAFFLLFWFAVLQLVPGLGGLGGSEGIAFWAHIGGFLVGVLYLLTLQDQGSPEAARYVRFRRVDR